MKTSDPRWSPVAPGDRTWLLMDRPNNLMHVHSMVWLAEVPDWDEVERVLRERLAGRYPVFHRKPVRRDGQWGWQDDPGFAMANHVRRVRLPGPASDGQTSAYVSSRASLPLDRSKPLWEVDFIEGVPGFDGAGEGALVLARYHHSLADGVRLVQVALSLLDPLTDQAMAPSAVGRDETAPSTSDLVLGAVRTTASGVTDFVRGAGATAARAPRAASELRPGDLPQLWRRLRQPTRIVDRVSEVASDGNALVNTVRSVARLGLAGRSVRTVWSGTPGIEKTIWWVPRLPLDEVRRIGAANGVTINDVLVSLVAIGVTDYLVP